MATKKSKFKVGDEVTIRARSRSRTATKGQAAIVSWWCWTGHAVPVRLSVDKVKAAGRSERSARYFLESAD